MSIWSSIGRKEEQQTCHLDEYGQDEPRAFDIAFSGNGFVRIAAFGLRAHASELPPLERVERLRIYVRVEDIDLLISKLQTARDRDIR